MGILQARILEWVAIPFSRGSSWLTDRTQVSCMASRFFTIWATREAHHVQSAEQNEMWGPLLKNYQGFQDRDSRILNQVQGLGGGTGVTSSSCSQLCHCLWWQSIRCLAALGTGDFTHTPCFPRPSPSAHEEEWRLVQEMETTWGSGGGTGAWGTLQWQRLGSKHPAVTVCPWGGNEWDLGLRLKHVGLLEPESNHANPDTTCHWRCGRRAKTFRRTGMWGLYVCAELNLTPQQSSPTGQAGWAQQLTSKDVPFPGCPDPLL